jgi:hypothetical protein
MSGPAGSRDHQPRGTGAHANDRIRRNARSQERAKQSRAFLLTKTWMPANRPEPKRGRHPSLLGGLSPNRATPFDKTSDRVILYRARVPQARRVFVLAPGPEDSRNVGIYAVKNRTDTLFRSEADEFLTKFSYSLRCFLSFFATTGRCATGQLPYHSSASDSGAAGRGAQRAAAN